MMLFSEKKFYEPIIKMKNSPLKYDLILWGEDLIDHKIIVYDKEISDIPGNDEERKLDDACLMYVNPHKPNDSLKTASVKLNQEIKEVFIQKAIFKSIWKFLKNSVQLGIELAKRSKTICKISKPDDILVLTYIENEKVQATIRNTITEYKYNGVSNSEKELIRKKQSALDNKTNRYFYSMNGSVFHDKDCEAISGMSPLNFRASQTIPEGMRPCPGCRRKMALREASLPYVKQMPVIDRMLTSKNVGDRQLWEYAYKYHIKFCAFEYDTLKVTSKEDTWLIGGFYKDELTLSHNNYIKLSPIERVITSGFHMHNTNRMRLQDMFEYIYEYTFDRHLEGVIAKQSSSPEIVQEIIDSYETLGIEETMELILQDKTKENIGKQIVEQIKYNIGLWSRFRRAADSFITMVF